MADVTIEQNLLFGVIAHRDGWITLEHFGDVCNAWAVRMHMPLADLLLERGWISAEVRREIQRTLERIVKRFKGDVRASLGAIAKADVRDAIRAVDHPEVRQSLRGLPPAAGFVRAEAPTLMPPNRDRSSRYTLQQLLPGGSLGQVWLAHDTVMLREVALKEIRTAQAGHPDAEPRLLKEAQITGQLEHPNIVPVYELARRPEDNQPFYVMRFVRGPTLGDQIAGYHQRRRKGRVDPVEQLQLLNAFVTICQAIGYAHTRGVVHRDLKPENVVLGGFGEVIVLDWGLAKLVDRPDDDAPEVTLSAEARTHQATMGQVGTPAYMAPEQAEGRNDLIDARTDIYGLGAILFEILTGRPPVEGTQLEVFLKLRTGPSPRARAVEPAVPEPLDEICARAMAHDRARRYGRATELADAVQRWIADATRLAQANARVDALATAEVREVPGIIRELGDDRRLVRDRLREMARPGSTEPHAVRRRTHAALALLADDAGQADTLAVRLLQAETQPDELIVIRQALRDQGKAGPRTPRFWAELERNPRELTDAQFRAAGVLASFAPDDPRWSDLGRPVAEKLVLENPLLIGSWREVFQQVSGALVEPLRAIHGDRTHSEQRTLAASLLFEFAGHPDNSHQTADLIELIGEADPPLFRRILDIISNRAQAIALLTTKIDVPAHGDDVQARRQGQAAAALARLGQPERIWPLFKHSNDPSLRTELILDLAKFGVDPRAVIERLPTEPEVSARRALVLALGEYLPDQVSADDRRVLVQTLLDWYRAIPDPGVHGAVDWLLRQRWDHAHPLDLIDRELSRMGSS